MRSQKTHLSEVLLLVLLIELVDLESGPPHSHDEGLMAQVPPNVGGRPGLRGDQHWHPARRDRACHLQGMHTCSDKPWQPLGMVHAVGLDCDCCQT